MEKHNGLRAGADLSVEQSYAVSAVKESLPRDRNWRALFCDRKPATTVEISERGTKTSWDGMVRENCVGTKRRSEVLITKFLRHHQAADAAVHDADAEAAELRMQDVGAMAG